MSSVSLKNKKAGGNSRQRLTPQAEGADLLFAWLKQSFKQGEGQFGKVTKAVLQNRQRHLIDPWIETRRWHHTAAWQGPRTNR